MEQKEVLKFDAIVVGAGPSGVASAIVAARGGAKVLLVERSSFAGEKNMFGGAVFLSALKELLPNTWQSAPFERYILKHSWALLSDKTSCEVSYQSFDEPKSASVYRSKFDSWLVEEAKKEGVYFAPSTLVKSLISKNGHVVGVKTELEEIYANVVVLADGVNSILARDLGLRKEYEPKDMVLSVKETRKLPKSLIEQRFNLKENSKEGAAKNFLGGLAKENPPFGLGFLYTFEDTISIGLGVNLEDLNRFGYNPSDLLENLKKHPSVSAYLEGSELLEYSAHLIYEGGYKKLPKLCANGVLIVGDAAGFVNAVHFEGTNFAIISGMLAGETVLSAISAKDFSKKTLSIYKKKLNNSFILKDLKSYKNVMDNLYSRTNSLMNYYPKKAAEFFKIFTGASCKPKRGEFREFIKSFFSQRSLGEFFKDIWAFLSAIIGVLK